MFPNPVVAYDLETFRRQDLLTTAARERLASEATRDVAAPGRIDKGRAWLRRALVWIAAIEPAARWFRQLANV